MTEWEKFKVAELKEECKSRQISITGLKLKQQYVDKLNGYETSASRDATPAEESVAEKTNGAFDEVAKDSIPEGPILPQDEEQKQNGKPESVPGGDVALAVENDKNLPAERPIALKVEDSQGLEASSEDEEPPTVETEREVQAQESNGMLIPESDHVHVETDASKPNEPDDDEATADKMEVDQSLKEAIAGPVPTQIVDDINQKEIPEASTPDLEVKNRKKRSRTPSVDGNEISKKAKSHTGEAIPTKRGSRPSSPREQETASTKRSSPQPDSDKDLDNDASRAVQQSRDRSMSVDKEETVEPALHAATCSLYLKNFKRPLNVQSLRSHIMTIAKGSSSVAQDEDPIKFFNVNSIRSHAFVKFSSITPASRVRAAMHQTRFPDEPQRDPLWVDFIPDEKVEEWVEQETGGTRALGRNSATKLEVTYNDTGNGIEAVFQEAYPSRGSRPSLNAAANHDSSIAQRQASYAADPTRTTSIASGIHPDRAPLVPRSPKSLRKESTTNTYEPERRSEGQGHGFRGLDDLYSSTKAKPKVYYKLKPQSVIDSRLDMIQDLYSDRGISGQPGMKRYTFESDRGRDSWVDNGPEFGHGKRGQDRLAGIGGRGRGGYRGRGARGGFYSGDSYRGGGRR